MRSLTVIATTGDGFEHLGPYVASINEVGEVAFQATRAAGAGIFFSDGRGTKELFGPPRLQDVTSHPDINGARATAFYGELELGRPAVIVSEEQHLYAIAEADGNRFASIGPAGPTMNGSGAVAFRAERSDGASGLYLADRESVAVVAETDERWARFHGLPLVNERRAVVFRADRHDGRQGIYAWREGATRSIVETGTSFETISLFPSASNGVIAFAATLSEGGAQRSSPLNRNGSLASSTPESRSSHIAGRSSAPPASFGSRPRTAGPLASSKGRTPMRAGSLRSETSSRAQPFATLRPTPSP